MNGGIINQIRSIQMPDDLTELWQEGAEYFRAKSELQNRLDSDRGWTEGTTQTLVKNGYLSLPIIKGHRGLAFPVLYPSFGDRGSIYTFQAGIHIKHKPKNQGCKSFWTYHPNQNSHKCNVIAAPIIIGSFHQAEIAIICEGEWDAITFAAAAGWLSSGITVPHNIAVVGIPGADNWRRFISLWNDFWPKSARFLLIPDKDKAGEKWQRSFSHELKVKGRGVIIHPPKGNEGKDFNEMHKARPVNPEGIRRLLDYVNTYPINKL